MSTSLALDNRAAGCHADRCGTDKLVVRYSLSLPLTRRTSEGTLLYSATDFTVKDFVNTILDLA